MPEPIPDTAIAAIIAAGHRLDLRNWVPATAGNFSLRLPGGRIAVTRSGVHKGFLGPEHAMVVDGEGLPEDPALRPSAETLLHCGIYRRFPEARAVLHGHSIANTVLSRRAGKAIVLQGYELLKAFPGLPTHDAAVSVPVVPNDQDIARMQRGLERRWGAMAGAGEAIPPGYLIRGHGIYVWAETMDGALARLEALEFMLECELQDWKERER
ncbi:methylthioribulose 1-phosphate dehydratase [Teichococcus vastitatis]|uniref:Methylthioribulose-1-phosphate dehydratase n=1 Tax=Teichococcus vastitatis TaxID=2307076 RepID=A0ABS9W566_9PROT|nr:methylthioribulose 1-phosphate dehydratase [Pseudoroseomonas vastitatis]MCI0754367.1 methylthioribulose 1-phosphate dehydratase [Pseudoroseomonas vastitatis]